jgi:transposase InsO family protein
MIDNFSHFVFAEPIKDTTAESAAKFIIKISAQFGLPKAFRWDNCSQFEGHLVRCLLALIGADKHPSVPYNPETNGIVERVIQEIMRHLRFICNEKRMQTEWDVYLPLVLRILNAEKVATIGLSPVEILLPGIDLDSGLFPTADSRSAKASINAIPEKARRVAVQQWLTHLQELQVQAIKTAGQRVDLIRKKIDGKEITKKFEEGDYVVTQWRAGVPNKLSVKYQGPYKVLKQLSNSTYRVRDPADGAEKEKHVSELYHYYLSEGEDVRDTIAMDDFEELVDKVVDHRRKEGSTSLRDLDFKIRWLGKGPAEDTWHEYSEMTRKGGLQAFWDYVKAHPELKTKVKP